jgi:hypothetical protein
VVRAQLIKGAPPPGLGAFVVREVCRALAYAHALVDDNGTPFRLIHRDVSPSNVMISFDGAVKLLDFGIAKALAEANENRTVTGTLKGKFGYMSPEQVEGKDVDHRSDLFAAGVCLHEVLTGKRLFKGASDLQTIAMVRDARVDPPSLLNPAVPPELDAICLKALARVPDERWRGCDEMAVALDEVVHGLKWGSERLASLQRDLFPDEPSNSSIVNLSSLAETAAPHDGVRVGALKRQRLRRQAAWAGGALAVLAVASLVTVRSLRSGIPAQPAPAPVIAPVAATAPPAPVAPPVPATVTVRVATTPSGAEVFLDDEHVSRGRTPLAMTVPRSTTTNVRVTARLRGYEEQGSDLLPDSDSRLQMNLMRVMPTRPAVAARPKPAQKAKVVKPAPSRPKQPVPDLHRGDVVDPFAR